jgi:hypothetical protein
MKLTCFIDPIGIAAANTLHIQYFDCVDSRDRYNELYEQLVRVKDIVSQPFADNAQQLLVTYIREDLWQLRAAQRFERQWTGPFGRYNLAHAGNTWSNNNMGTVDWRDIKGGCPLSATLGTFTGCLVSLIGQIGAKHHVLRSKA